MFIGKACSYTHIHPHTHLPATNSPWPSGPVCRWFSEHEPPLMLPPGCQSPQSRNLWLVFTWREAEILSQPVPPNIWMCYMWNSATFCETYRFTACKLMLLWPWLTLKNSRKPNDISKHQQRRTSSFFEWLHRPPWLFSVFYKVPPPVAFGALNPVWVLVIHYNLL